MDEKNMFYPSSRWEKKGRRHRGDGDGDILTSGMKREKVTMRDSGHDEIVIFGHNRGDGAVAREGEVVMCILSVLVFRNAAVGGLMRWRKGVGGNPLFLLKMT